MLEKVLDRWEDLVTRGDGAGRCSEAMVLQLIERKSAKWGALVGQSSGRIQWTVTQENDFDQLTRILLNLYIKKKSKAYSRPQQRQQQRKAQRLDQRLRLAAGVPRPSSSTPASRTGATHSKHSKGLCGRQAGNRPPLGEKPVPRAKHYISSPRQARDSGRRQSRIRMSKLPSLEVVAADDGGGVR